jgi:CubicO group peptidase (beta-lactamase class C family)/Zn-dependent protease with chaperone function
MNLKKRTSDYMNIFNEFVFDSDTSQVIGWTLLHSIWQITILAILFAVVRWFLVSEKRTTAAKVYWLGCATLFLMMAAPMLTFISLEPTAVVVDLEQDSRAALANAMVIGTSESKFLLLPNSAAPSSSSNTSQTHREFVTADQLHSESAALSFWEIASRRMLPFLTLGWFVGVIGFSIRPILGLCRVQILKASACSKLSEPIRNVAERAIKRTGLKQTIEFATSKKIEIPTVIGVWKPIVLFPLSALTQLTPQQLETILIHELAHVRRHDYLMNLFQTVIESLLFFHPGVWWVSMIVRAERENCCDDVAVELGNVKEYASALLVLENARPIPAPALGANGGNLVSRVRRLVKPALVKTSIEQRQLRQHAPWQASIFAVLMLTTLIAIGQRPALVAAAVFSQEQQSAVENPAKIRKDFAKTKLGKVLDSEMKKLKQVGFSGSVLVAHKGKIILAKSEGYEDQRTRVPTKPHTLFELASFSKSFTSTAAMILAQQQKLNLDASIADYLPSVPNNCQKITVRHLMQHTSGIPSDNYGKTDQDLATAVKTMLTGGPQTEPGKKHLYWNQGYILLSEIVAKAAGKPFPDAVKELILDPCDMTGTCFTGDKAPDGFRVSIGTGQMGPPRTCLEHPYGKLELIYQGTGGMVSNVFDIWKFHTALNSDKLLNENSRQQLFDAAGFTAGYALGWRIGEAPNGDPKHSHGGSVRGFNCFFARFPKSDSCIVVLSNNDASPTKTVSNVIESILFPAAMPGEIAADSAKIFVGEYMDAKQRWMTVEWMGNQLHYAIFWGGKNNPSAPVSRGLILQNDDGDFVMYQPGDSDVVEVEMSNDRTKVKSINLTELELKFERTK